MSIDNDPSLYLSKSSKLYKRVDVRERSTGKIEVVKTTVGTSSETRINFPDNAKDGYLVHRDANNLLIGEAGNVIMPIVKDEKWYFERIKKGNANDIFGKATAGTIVVYVLSEV